VWATVEGQQAERSPFLPLHLLTVSGDTLGGAERCLAQSSTVFLTSGFVQRTMLGDRHNRCKGVSGCYVSDGHRPNISVQRRRTAPSAATDG
jgi:hypothetical protein